MPIDTDKIDETVLALLHLTLHDRARAWKGHDWEALNRLHRKGMIGDPVGKAKSVVLTDQGLAGERAFVQKAIREGTRSLIFCRLPALAVRSFEPPARCVRSPSDPHRA